MSERINRLAQAHSTARELVDELERGQTPIDGSLMKARRLARLLRDVDAQRWLGLELSGYPSGFAFPSLETCETYARFGRMTHEGKYWPASLPAVEASLRASAASLASTPSAPVAPKAENYLVAGATQQVIGSLAKLQAERERGHRENQRLFSALKAGLHEYVAQTLIALELGDAAADIIEQARDEVDVFVRSTCPKAATQLVAMNERLLDGDVEALTAALTACRRLLKTVADAVFPAQESPYEDASGKQRKVGDEEYKNRLIAFVERSMMSETTRAIVASEITHLAARLDAVYEKTCKGVHADVSVSEARLAVIHSYLFVAEVARAAPAA